MHQKVVLKQLKADILSGLTVHEIAAKHGCTPSGIYRRCQSRGLVKPKRAPHRRKRKHTFNTRFFRRIDSEVKAYMLGFISADGGRDRQWGLKIALHPRDKDILDKFAAHLQCNFRPRLVEGGTRVKLALYDIDLVHDLEQYGIVERKTFSLPFARRIPVKYLRHYLRGVFDGDGSLGRQARLVAGSKAFYEGFITWYEKKYGQTPWHRQEGNKYRLVFNRRDAKFIRWMYTDNPIGLDRKQQLFQQNWIKS